MQVQSLCSLSVVFLCLLFFIYGLISSPDISLLTDDDFINFFYQELAALGKNLNSKAGRKTAKKDRENIPKVSTSRGLDRKGKQDAPKVNAKLRDRNSKPQRVENLVKEEGEMSDNEEVYEHFKEVKWMEWCEDVMADEIKTLERLQRLQTTSAKLPKEKVPVILVPNFEPICFME